MDKPDVDQIDGLSPAVSIDQKSTSRNPRSTVGTVTEIYDYLRLLYARVGKPHCPSCGRRSRSSSPSQVVDRCWSWQRGRASRCSRRSSGAQGRVPQGARGHQAEGFVRVRVDGEVRDLSGGHHARPVQAARHRRVVDRLVVKQGIEKRLADRSRPPSRWAKALSAWT
jgi:excinuclease ABC subunit A